MTALLALRALMPRLFKAAPLIVAGVLLAALVVQRHTIVVTTAARDAAQADVREFQQLVTDATVVADAKGKRALLSALDARAALTAAIRDRDDARASLRRVDGATKAAKARDATADAALAREQAANRRQYADAAPRIAELAAAKPAGPDADAAAIERDSRAAWEGWR